MADAAFSTSPPTEGHIRSTAWLCLAIFRKHGMRSAMNMLLEAARQFIPVTRINGVFISRDGSSILNIFDTHPNDRMVSYYLSPELTASLTAGQTAWKVKRAIRLEDIGAPTLINDLSPYKKPELLRNPGEGHSLPCPQFAGASASFCHGTLCVRHQFLGGRHPRLPPRMHGTAEGTGRTAGAGAGRNAGKLRCGHAGR